MGNMNLAADAALLHSEAYVSAMRFHVNAMSRCREVLDSGCGTGNVTLQLLKQRKRVHAVDKDRGVLGILEKRCAPYNRWLDARALDAVDLPFGDCSFDGVTSMFVLHAVGDTESYLVEHYRVLKGGGFFALSGKGERAPVIHELGDAGFRDVWAYPKSGQCYSLIACK